MIDFTLKKYKELLISYKNAGFETITFKELFLQPNRNEEKVLLLRHDVDAKPMNSLYTGIIENDLGLVGTYYFRNRRSTFNKKVIIELENLGHEIGYHYENLSDNKGNTEKAIADFEKNLSVFRDIADIQTISMHGSPLSSYDNRDLWKNYNYKDYGLLGEPYFDIDYDKFFYVTDTGRSWLQSSSNLRDNVTSRFNYNFSNTDELISAINKDKIHNYVVQNIHPQRWNDNKFFWLSELIKQNIKNQGKFFLNYMRRK